MPFKIPDNLLANPDRKSAFNGIREWMQQEMASSRMAVDGAVSTGCQAIDEALGGGYAPGKITEIVEPLPSRGGQSLIHESIRLSREKQQFIALVDACNQFDPHSDTQAYLQCLLWVRCPKPGDALKACDILIRDGNFPLLYLDLRLIHHLTGSRIRPNEWYRLQRVSEQSRIAFVVFTSTSTVPCAGSRLQLEPSLRLSSLDYPEQAAVKQLKCVVLKRRIFNNSPETFSAQPIAMGSN